MAAVHRREVHSLHMNEKGTRKLACCLKGKVLNPIRLCCAREQTRGGCLDGAWGAVRQRALFLAPAMRTLALVPGPKNTISLRLWSAEVLASDFDLEAFNAGGARACGRLPG